MRRFLLLLLLAAPVVCFAEQDPAPSSAHGKDPGFRRPHMPPELRERFRAAREKALEDAKVRELRDKMESAAAEFRAAMREAMTKADPGLAQELKKLRDEKDGRRGGAFAKLSEGERQRLMAAREVAKNDPAVAAAREKREKAQTPEERQTAGKQFHDAMRAAMLKADPGLASVLDRVRPPDADPKTP